MQRPLDITFRDVPHSDSLEADIRDKVSKLEALYPHVTGCHVVVEMPHKHNHQGREFVVRVDVKVPGGELVINHEHNADAHVAVRDAFDAAKRKLQDYARRQRGDVKHH
ncbi:MAG TPA: HPF/RaiA family ribosome-associated protein [Burkholderiales bacterium]|nr:HPF/RaiA family ribosome-associated protein [Burkholderiales bacterium]